MKSQRSNLFPDGIWPVFGAMCVIGFVMGLLGGAEHLGDVIFAVVLFVLPSIFIIWGVSRLDPKGIDEITGYTPPRSREPKTNQ